MALAVSELLRDDGHGLNLLKIRDFRNTLFCPPYGAVDCATNGAFRHDAAAK